MLYEETTTETNRESFDENTDTITANISGRRSKVNLNYMKDVYRPAVGDGRLIVRYSFADKKLA